MRFLNYVSGGNVLPPSQYTPSEEHKRIELYSESRKGIEIAYLSQHKLMIMDEQGQGNTILADHISSNFSPARNRRLAYSLNNTTKILDLQYGDEFPIAHFGISPDWVASTRRSDYYASSGDGGVWLKSLGSSDSTNTDPLTSGTLAHIYYQPLTNISFCSDTHLLGGITKDNLFWKYSISQQQSETFDIFNGISHPQFEWIPQGNGTLVHNSLVHGEEKFFTFNIFTNQSLPLFAEKNYSHVHPRLKESYITTQDESSQLVKYENNALISSIHITQAVPPFEDICSSPYDQKVLFSARTPDDPSGDYEIFLADFRTNSVRQLTSNSVDDRSPKFILP